MTKIWLDIEMDDFSQTTRCYLVLQCNSAISFLAFSQGLVDNSWIDGRKNIIIDVNNVQFGLNEG